MKSVRCLLLMFLSWQAAVWAAKEVYFCDTMESASLPSLLDVANVTMSAGGKESQALFQEFLMQYEDQIPGFLLTGIPLAHWFSDGLYTFHLTQDRRLQGKIVEINLLQQDSQWSLINIPFCLMQWSSWCSCAAEDASDLAKLHFENTAPCKTRLSNTVTEIYVDPSRPSCIQLIVENSASDELYRQTDRPVVAFSVQVPTAHSSLAHILLTRLLPDFPEVVNGVLFFLSHLPLYLISGLLGIYLTYHASDIAEEKAYQLVLQIVLGLGTALVLLGFLAHRILNTLLARHAPSFYSPKLIDSLFGLFVGSISFQYRHFLFGQAVQLLLQFWDEGAFGYWWLGRAYFAVCIFGSLSICHAFDLFRDPDSRSFVLTLFSCRLVGLTLLLHSSSNTLVAYGITACVLLSAQMQSYVHYGYYALSGYLRRSQRATLAGSFASPAGKQNQYNKEQLEAAVRRNTSKHLEQLRTYLKDKPAELARFEQRMREDNKDTTANLLQQFAANIYTGRPRPPVAPETVSWAKRLRLALRNFGVLVVLVAIVAAFSLKSDVVVDFLKNASSAVNQSPVIP